MRRPPELGPAQPSPGTPVPVPRAEPLPFTGAPVTGLALAGIVLLGGGAVLLVVRRRHRTATSG